MAGILGHFCFPLVCITLASLSGGVMGQPVMPDPLVIQLGGKYGYINQSGKVVIPATFYKALDFSECKAIVMSTTEAAEIIDTQGNQLGVLRQCAYVGPFLEGVAVLMRGERHSEYINAKGEKAIPQVFTGAADFSEGLAAAANQFGKWGWIDKSGRFVIAPQFDVGGEFKEGIARFGRKNKSGYLDKTGKIIAEANYFTAQDFSEGLGLAWDGKERRYLNKSGEVVINFPGNAGVLPFHEGLAAVIMDGNAYFIDKTGKTVLKTSFDLVSSFSEGLAPVRVGDKTRGKWGCIDKTGKVIIEPQFPDKPVFKNGLAKIKTTEGIGYIDRTGKWVWKPSR